MSQHPSRPPGGYGPSGWSARPTSHSPFRPASPARGPPTPIHHPMSPLTYPGMMHPMSPVPIGMPISPGMSPVFGCPPPGFIQCPRPRWPSPVSTGNAAPRPYIPQSPIEAQGAPVPCGPPEYLIAPYRPGDYEYVGVPLEPSQNDDEDSGPSTAEIIASQSQDYVDEKLAEYQATIALLQGQF
ncbi:leucine-rich repeat extensin-like protein 3 [Diachasma alloeum]|uniref:leucine-rich repeat extensin-like protein 3 n=1 Tax=Diachasma alloeum TaxID=454923 RepID=UPI00073844F1|nr:leucine-rich repeat extensin-like protein 3 [Diachasma alloeum]